MDLKTSTESVAQLNADWLLVPVVAGTEKADARLPEAARAVLARAIAAGDVTGASGELVKLYASEPEHVGRLMTVGLGLSLIHI